MDEIPDLEPQVLEALLERDRTRVAQMQIKQALKSIELYQRAQNVTVLEV